MSLIVVRQTNNNTLIVSDTKLTNNSNYINQKIKEEERIAGVIKAIIINQKICICWAGDIGYAEEAFKAICNTDPLEKMIETLLQFNKLAILREVPNPTSFILCTSSPVRNIYIIKNGASLSVSEAWIGDGWAYNKKFKKYLDGKEVNISTMSSALDEVINDRDFDTVGGFNVSIAIDRSRFKYNFYRSVCREPLGISIRGSNPFIIGDGTVQNGAYTFNFIGSSEDYQHIAIYIPQGRIGIIYSRTNAGLFYPEFKKDTDENTFYTYIENTYKIFPTIKGFQSGFKISPPPNFQLYFKDALIAFHSGDYVNAITLFDNANLYANRTEIAESLLYKWKACCYLKKSEAAYVYYQISQISPSYIKEMMEFLHEENEKNR